MQMFMLSLSANRVEIISISQEIFYLIKTNFLVFIYPHSFCLTADEEIQFQEPDQAWRFQLSKSQIKPGGSNLVYVCFQISL